MEKNIAIVVAGAQGQEIKDLAIKPGTTARDILKTLELDRYVVSRRDGRLFGPHDNVYEAVENGEKLYASTEAEVG
jgi:DNA-binding PadR family transcriptional regulator